MAKKNDLKSAQNHGFCHRLAALLLDTITDLHLTLERSLWVKFPFVEKSAIEVEHDAT